MLDLLHFQVGKAGGGMSAGILATLQAQMKSCLTYCFLNAHTFQDVIETPNLQNLISLLLLTL